MNFDVKFDDNSRTFNSSFVESSKMFNSSFGETLKVTDPTQVVLLPKIDWVTLLADKWVGESNLYHQVVSIEGITKNSQVDLTPDVQQLIVFYEKDLSFVTENENGTVTVYAIGQKPTQDYTVQVTITEVE